MTKVHLVAAASEIANYLACQGVNHDDLSFYVSEALRELMSHLKDEVLTISLDRVKMPVPRESAFPVR